ncbi:unnamed protein product [Schistosoma spindalis]|nr:unnamed protein product [Schistosoma spindale]
MECVSGSGGCFIGFATSWGKSHPPENVLDKREGSFWITTGLFPQVLVISFDQPRRVSQIKIVTSKVKALCIYSYYSISDYSAPTLETCICTIVN